MSKRDYEGERTRAGVILFCAGFVVLLQLLWHLPAILCRLFVWSVYKFDDLLHGIMLELQH